VARNWAICVGINNYEFVGKLKYAQRDARAMHDFCKTELKFEKVYYFAEDGDAIAPEDGFSQIAASPTFGHLDQFLDMRFKQRNFLNPQDNLWFFFAGHGIRAEGIDYLLPIDGNPNRIQRTGLPIHEVAERLRRCGAGNIVLMLDACRDGDSRKASLAGIGAEASQGVVTLFSCGANEQSYEIAEHQHGAFTYALLEGLRQKGPQNCATVDRLSAYVKGRVIELNRLNNRRQTPLVKAEPIEKLHLVLLPDRATVHDVAPLKRDALKAEVVDDLDAARQYWIQVLAVLRADMEAIEGIERLALKRAEKRAKLPQTAQTMGIDGHLTDTASVREVIKQPALSTFEFDFEVVTVDANGNEATREWKSAEQRREVLAEGVDLEMVLLEGGSFLLGAPRGEGIDRERPQHRVTLPSFWMGKYPITQAQWQAVAAMPKVERELDPDPSNFKGDNRPVEQVSWYEAVEFCQRLSQHTNKEYSLPSEAAWEYACRAATTTPFHFGETITTALANYCGQDREINGKTYSGSHGSGPKGEFREQTTNVGSFPANAFGLCDMHGNVWEWCLDHRHTNYASAPTDGSAWLSADENSRRVLRGGSWYNSPRNCRSAYRNLNPEDRFNLVGFRVSCAAPRT